MSYRDPKAVQQRSGIIDKGIANMLTTIASNKNAYAQEKKKEKAAASAALNKVAVKAKMGFDEGYQNAKSASDKFTSGLYGESGKQTEDAMKFTGQIEGVLSGIGTKLNRDILDIQERGGSADEIAKLKNGAIAQMNKFTVDMANWDSARQQYMAAKRENPGAVGSLLTDPDLQINSDMIVMFEKMLDDKEDNLYISLDPTTGNTLISAGTITDGVADIKSSKDMTVFAKNHEEFGEGGYFETNEEFTHGDYGNFTTLLKDLEGVEEVMGEDGNLDYEKVEEYLLSSDRAGGNKGTYLSKSSKQWASGPISFQAGGDSKFVGEVGKGLGKDLMNAYKNEKNKWGSLDATNEQEYLYTIFNRGWNLYESEKAKEERENPSSKGKSGDTRVDEFNVDDSINTPAGKFDNPDNLLSGEDVEAKLEEQYPEETAKEKEELKKKKEKEREDTSHYGPGEGRTTDPSDWSK
jgi:hypothetical protein